MLTTKMLKIGVFIVLLGTSFVACMELEPQRKIGKVNDEMERKVALMEVDKAFAKASLNKGLKAAFTEYIDSNGVLLRPDNLPIVGADAVDFLSQLNADEFTLVWEPKGVEISVSDDMGITYGIYSMKALNQDTVFSGTYVNVWRKQPNGKWRYILNSGNAGLPGPDIEN